MTLIIFEEKDLCGHLKHQGKKKKKPPGNYKAMVKSRLVKLEKSKISFFTDLPSTKNQQKLVLSS